MPCFVTINPKTQHIKCLGGCKNKYSRKRSEKPYFSLDEIDTDNLCIHVRAVIKEEDIIHEYLTNETTETQMRPEDEEFCVKTGKWKSKALGKHKPLSETDPLFIK